MLTPESLLFFMSDCHCPIRRYYCDTRALDLWCLPPIPWNVVNATLVVRISLLLNNYNRHDITWPLDAGCAHVSGWIHTWGAFRNWKETKSRFGFRNGFCLVADHCMIWSTCIAGSADLATVLDIPCLVSRYACYSFWIVVFLPHRIIVTCLGTIAVMPFRNTLLFLGQRT